MSEKTHARVFFDSFLAKPYILQKMCLNRQI